MSCYNVLGHLSLSPSKKNCLTSRSRCELAKNGKKKKKKHHITRTKNVGTMINFHSVSIVQFIDVGTMVSPTVYARRSLCHLMCDQPDAALRDAMQAQCVYPDWSTAFYMQAVALAKLDMHKDAADMLNEAAALEEKKQRGGRGS